MFGKIKIKSSDKYFSIFIRLRDKYCVRCGRAGDGNMRINGLQASHFYGRARQSTRYDPQNVDALCAGCHQYWGSTDREAYRVFKVKQLGQKAFDLLTLRANTIDKSIDERVITMYYKQEIKKYVNVQM